MTDPKAAEREAPTPTPEQHDAARAFVGAHEDSTMSDAIGALAALLAARERDAAVGALERAVDVALLRVDSEARADLDEALRLLRDVESIWQSGALWPLQKRIAPFLADYDARHPTPSTPRGPKDSLAAERPGRKGETPDANTHGQTGAEADTGSQPSEPIAQPAGGGYLPGQSDQEAGQERSERPIPATPSTPTTTEADYPPDEPVPTNGRAGMKERAEAFLAQLRDQEIGGMLGLVIGRLINELTVAGARAMVLECFDGLAKRHKPASAPTTGETEGA